MTALEVIGPFGGGKRPLLEMWSEGKADVRGGLAMLVGNSDGSLLSLSRYDKWGLIDEQLRGFSSVLGASAAT